MAATAAEQCPPAAEEPGDLILDLSDKEYEKARARALELKQEVEEKQREAALAGDSFARELAFPGAVEP